MDACAETIRSSEQLDTPNRCIERDAMATVRDAIDWQAALSASQENVLAAARAGRIAETALTRATVARMMAALTLNPAPRDPVQHLQAAHAEARGHLVRLTDHDPAIEVRAALGSWTYTPRKALRRVLDHVLAHLNQIDQWLAWRRDGASPSNRLRSGRVGRAEVKNPLGLGSVFIPRGPGDTLGPTMRADHQQDMS